MSNKHETYAKYQQYNNFPKQRSWFWYNVAHLQYEVYQYAGLE